MDILDFAYFFGTTGLSNADYNKLLALAENAGRASKLTNTSFASVREELFKELELLIKEND